MKKVKAKTKSKTKISKSKTQNNSHRKKSNPNQQEGALQNGLKILAQMKDGSWQEAKIIDARPVQKERISNQKKESSFQYYVHYENFNRRNDEWITYERIKEWQHIESKPEGHTDHDEHEGIDQQSIQQHEEATKFKTIDFIEMGGYKCETWYFSPFPEYYQNINTLYICEFCMSFFKYQEELVRHSYRCSLIHPPGNEIYRKDNVSVFEVDGLRQTIYCENLCYIAKLFLDHKTLYYDVEPFLFYILTEVDQTGCHFVGYFSKEKESTQGYNLACILTMPFHQRKGYGKFLIDFSYVLSKKEKKIGTPERPLSDLGFASYFGYWSQQIVELLLKYENQTLSINEISELTAIKQSDVQYVLEKQRILRLHNNQQIIYTEKNFLKGILKSAGRPGLPVYEECLHWIPFKFDLGYN